MKVKDGFSSIKCKGCQKVTISSTWRCRCHRKWAKCPMHVHESMMWASKSVKAKRKQTEGEKQKLLRGIDVRKPVRRGHPTGNPHQVLMHATSSSTTERAFFKHDSVFAKSFPRLLQERE